VGVKMDDIKKDRILELINEHNKILKDREKSEAEAKKKRVLTFPELILAIRKFFGFRETAVESIGSTKFREYVIYGGFVNFELPVYRKYYLDTG
jgi:hypothetical protein